ncbi:YraN family protein [Myxococcota bacterium]|nr:YraN family protein [Myxococcota bacterium]
MTPQENSSQFSGKPVDNAEKRRMGAEGEDIALRYLEKKGYQLITRNFHAAGGEIDIIAMDQDVLCFVEVRTKQNDEHGHPLETINAEKRSRIIRAARRYLNELETPWPDEMRFDAVGILLGPPLEIELVKDAFEVSG